MTSLSLLEEKIKSAKSILITAHVNPDGDALGSTMAMKEAIKNKYGKDADAIYIGKFPEIYYFMNENNELISFETIDSEKIYDVAIALDVASKERLLHIENIYNNAKFTVNIDHHKTNNNYGDFSLVNGDASSTGEVLYELFKSLDVEITKTIANDLYVSILTDTGCFKYNNTTEKSMLICSDLLSKGVNPSEIALLIYGSKPKAMIMLSAYAVTNANFLNNNRVAYATVTQKDLDTFNAESDYTEGIVEILKEINSVKIAILFKELKNGFVKVSFRSKGVDVAEICKKFEGGGHTNAAGCTIKKPMNIAIEKILEEIKDM